MTALPVAEGHWFRERRLSEAVTRIDEPHVDEFLRANIWHVRGRDRDLVVDAGLGVASLREHLPHLFAHDAVLIVTHPHLDHVGSAHEFDDVRLHADALGRPVAASLRGPELAELLGLDGAELPEHLLHARPSAAFDPDAYAARIPDHARALQEGDVIALGDRDLEVLHLPGHTPFDVGLLDRAAGLLLCGDVLYDGELLDGLHESDLHRYARSMRRIRALPLTTVLPGHDDPLPAARAHALIDAWLDGVRSRFPGAE